MVEEKGVEETAMRGRREEERRKTGRKTRRRGTREEKRIYARGRANARTRAKAKRRETKIETRVGRKNNQIRSFLRWDETDRYTGNDSHRRRDDEVYHRVERLLLSREREARGDFRVRAKP